MMVRRFAALLMLFIFVLGMISACVVKRVPPGQIKKQTAPGQMKKH
jgi:hypothetical protein